MSSFLKKIAPIASLALPFVFPGVGAALGGALGATGAGASALGSGLIGAGLGAAGGGGLKGALLGGLGSAAGGYLSGGGFGQAAGTALDKATGIAGMQGPTLGTGAVGSITRSVPGLGSLVGGGSGAGSGSLSTLLSGIQQYGTQDDIEKQLMEQQRRAEEAMNPYLQTGGKANQQLSDRLSAGFDPSQIANDPSYQFRLSEGQKALENSLAAQGMSQSGAALREAQDLGQRAASQEYGSAYDRWIAQNNQLAGSAGTGYNAAGSLGDIYGNQGFIKAGGTQQKSNVVNQTLSDLLRGNGSRVVGKDIFGNPIYG